MVKIHILHESLLEYKLMRKQGEGTFSEVFMAEHQKTGKQFAIKCMKNIFANEE